MCVPAAEMRTAGSGHHPWRGAPRPPQAPTAWFRLLSWSFKSTALCGAPAVSGLPHSVACLRAVRAAVWLAGAACPSSGQLPVPRGEQGRPYTPLALALTRAAALVVFVLAFGEAPGGLSLGLSWGTCGSRETRNTRDRPAGQQGSRSLPGRPVPRGLLAHSAGFAVELLDCYFFNVGRKTNP